MSRSFNVDKMEEPQTKKAPTPTFKYIPPPKSVTQPDFKPIMIPRTGTFGDTVKAYLKENPLVVVGGIGIFASFGTGMAFFYRGNSPKWEQRMMWSRCCWQAFTALAIGYSEYKRMKKVEEFQRLHELYNNKEQLKEKNKLN